MKSHSSWLRTALFSALAIALVTACALPVSPRSVEHPRGAKVVLRTPYGPAERGSGFGALSYQSTVMPVNLALVIDHFEVNLLGTGTLPDRPSEIVAWSEARQFVFEDVPAGTWTVQVEAFDANSRRIALGTYPSSVVVADDQVTSVPASIAVSPLRSSGSVTGDFQLTLREVPAEVDAVHLSLQAVALETDGSFSLTDVLSTNPTLVSGSLSGASGTPQVVSITGSNLPTGSYVLGVEFHRSDVADLKSTFSPQFTVEIYDNLESTLDVNLTTTATVAPSTPPNNPSVTLDANGDAVLHWNAVATSSHIQVALAVNPLVATPPTSAGELQGITTLPNYGFLNAWNSGITVGEQPSGQVRFWVRSIISGMYPSPWTSVLATQRVYYVRSDGGDGNAGTKNSPLATLQEAINRLQTGGTTTLKSTVHMAGGTYPVTAPILNATRDVPGTPAGMEQPVPITILGGWDPTFAVRDPATTPTVLDDTRSSTSVGDESILRFDEATAVASPLTTPQMIDGLTFRMTNDAGSATRQGLLFQGAMNVTLSNLTFQMQGVSGTSLEAMRVEPWQDSLARSIMVYGNTVTLRAAVPASHTTDMTGLSLFTASPFSALFVSVHNNVFDLGPTQGSISLT